MRVKNYFWLMAAALVATACSKDDVGGANNNGLDENGQIVNGAYTSITIKPSSVSRANPNGGEAGDGTEKGNGHENDIDFLQIYVFDAQGNICALQTDESATASYTLHLNVNSSNSTDPFLVSIPDKIEGGGNEGNVHVYVIANGDIAQPNNVNKDLKEDDFQDALINGVVIDNGGTLKYHYTTNTLAKCVMSNANGPASTSLTKNHTEQNPQEVSIKLDRLPAKIVYQNKGTNNQYVINDSENKIIARATITDIAIVNRRMSSYAFKHYADATGSNISIIGTELDGDNANYVVDPVFASKTVNNPWTDPTDYTNWYAGTYKDINDLTEFSTAINGTATEDQIIAYVSENTMPVNSQVAGYTTMAIFKAKIELGSDPFTQATTFYTYKDKIYSSFYNIQKDELSSFNIEDGTTKWKDLKAIFKANESADIFQVLTNVADTEDETIVHVADWNEYADKHQPTGIKIYTDGICYYNYFIKHNNNDQNDVMGIMEFAVVRNNVYKLHVSSINRIGDNVPTIDPEDKDEDIFPYLSVSCEILPWTIRLNDNIEL